MSDQIYFSGASYYSILEGESQFTLKYFGSNDPLFQERIEFKQNLINDLVVRLADANLKIKLLLTAKEKHHEEKRKYRYVSEEIALECSILDDALHTNLLEMAEILVEFLNRLRTNIPAKGHLFRKSKKSLAMSDKVDQKTYIQFRSFLFPKLDDAKRGGKVKHSYFHDVADRLHAIGIPVLTFRDKVLAHKYDKDRFVTHLSLEQYCEIRDALINTLDAIAIVGTFLPNDWTMTRSSKAILRTDKWLVEGLIDAAISIHRYGIIHPPYFKDSVKTVQCPNNPIDSK